MKKSMILFFVLAVLCFVSSFVYAKSVNPSEQSVSHGPKIQPSELNLEPNIAPAEFSNLVFGYAFDWGTSYETVLDFLSQLSGYELDKRNSYIGLRTADNHSAPEYYQFLFSDGKLTTITGSIYTLYMGSSAEPSLESIANTLKAVYGLQNLETYTRNDKMNAKASETNTSLIVADDYTIYGLFNMLRTDNKLSYVDFTLADRHQSETGISSADAGIASPWKEALGKSSETYENASEVQETASMTASGETIRVGNCRYGTRLSLGDKAEIINVEGLRMYEKPNDAPIEGLYAFPEREFSIIDGPICVDESIWWKIDFLGYIGWAREMNFDGLYYMEKR